MRRYEKKWRLRFKGMLAVLLIQKEPKMWNPIWKDIFEKRAKAIEDNSGFLREKLGLNSDTIHEALMHMGLCDDLDSWIALGEKVKTLMNKGVINFELKEQTLLSVIIMETMSLEELSNLWKKQQ